MESVSSSFLSIFYSQNLSFKALFILHLPSLSLLPLLLLLLLLLHSREAHPLKSALQNPPKSSFNNTHFNNQFCPSKKVLVPIGLGTEEMEAVILIGVLRRAGADVTVASVEPQLEIEAYGGTRLVADTSISTCCDQVSTLLHCRKHAEDKRLYGAICAAPAVTLLPWGLTRRKQITCHPAFIDKLSTFWAVKSNIQVSGELTTSRGPGTSLSLLCA
ncbi:hypothetical protein LWI29_003755 [Acer saccharum]|uniref:DJ-1/PfpI domain-containing protein n=1 Tax=Acer saccharum TaxID=4024 RepID=A0AA39RUP5_ACESA|nr:hypothetical protein LWI29_003755 [Acer saccharum]